MSDDTAADLRRQWRNQALAVLVIYLALAGWIAFGRGDRWVALLVVFCGALSELVLYAAYLRRRRRTGKCYRVAHGDDRRP